MTEALPALAAALVTGFLGSAHCVGMCAGISGLFAVQGEVAGLRTRLPMALTYNLGRILSYALLGAIVATLGGGAIAAMPSLAGPVRLVGGLVIVLIGLQIAFHWRILEPLERMGSLLWTRLAPCARRLLPATTLPRALGLGLVWGWLPCGLVYSVLLLATTSARSADGALIMLAFGAGTLPAMLATGLGAARLAAFMRRQDARLGLGLAIVILGLLTLAMPALGLLQPGNHHHQETTPMTLSRRDYLKASALAGAALALPPGLLHALGDGPLIRKAIPQTGEELPIVGLGTAASFREMSRTDETAALREVIRTLVDNGGTVLDTAPSYAEAEAVAGEFARELGMTETIFWATKVNDAPRGRPKADPARARAQLATSFDRIGKEPIDLIQVHNLGDLPTQMPIIEEHKADGRIRYIGTTTTRASEYDRLEKAMRDYPLDFIGVDYSVDHRVAADRVLPAARELGIAVLGYEPFGDGLFSRTRGVDLPPWAAEIGTASWAQFFLKFAAAHAAITCVTPATSKPQHMLDNIAAAYGELPDAAMQQRMIDFIANLPAT